MSLNQNSEFYLLIKHHITVVGIIEDENIAIYFYATPVHL